MRSTLTVLIASFTYAIIRYHILKGVSWVDFPLFISNKAIALSAVSFIALSYTLGSLAKFWPMRFETMLTFRKYFGLLGFGLASVHTMMSLLLFSPAYYPKFFTEVGKLSLVGELSMLFGVLSFFLFTIIAIISIPSVSETMDKSQWLKMQRMGYTGCFLVLLHVAIMGIEGWTNPTGWPGGLMPISLVATIIILTVFLLKVSATLFARHK